MAREQTMHELEQGDYTLPDTGRPVVRVQHIPDQVERPLAHDQPHDVEVVSGSRLHQILGSAAAAASRASEISTSDSISSMEVR